MPWGGGNLWVSSGIAVERYQAARETCQFQVVNRFAADFFLFLDEVLIDSDIE